MQHEKSLFSRPSLEPPSPVTRTQLSAPKIAKIRPPPCAVLIGSLGNSCLLGLGLFAKHTVRLLYSGVRALRYIRSHVHSSGLGDICKESLGFDFSIKSSNLINSLKIWHHLRMPDCTVTTSFCYMCFQTEGRVDDVVNTMEFELALCENAHITTSPS